MTETIGKYTFKLVKDQVYISRKSNTSINGVEVVKVIDIKINAMTSDKQQFERIVNNYRVRYNKALCKATSKK